MSSDHKEQKKALMKNIKSALVEQKQSMEKMVQVRWYDEYGRMNDHWDGIR